ncbi:MAG: peptidoglycan bridge formation glycyltransferase FemA/FemB family protein [Chloroflexota bacterium]|nr:peptidoglycan bridge formation glycyltransferase FemA/FemB family protein [Chloroflexota bacterium]
MNRTATTSTYQTTTAIPDAVWEGFVANEPLGSFLQSAAWGEFKEKWGWRARRVAVRRDGVLAAGAQVLFRPLPLGRSFAYIPRGPILPDDDRSLLATLLNEVHQLCRAEGALLLTVEPNWPLPTEGEERLKSLRFREAITTIQPSATIVLDIRPPEEEILMQMHSKWRYNIRLSGRKEVKVRTGGAEDFDIYHNLTATTGTRNDFATRPRGYYEDMWAAFQPDRACLFIAEYENRPLAAIIVVRVGKRATYLYGASSNEERNRMPNHALQWAAIRWARTEGCHWYDFWGIPPEVPVDGEVEEYGEGGLWGVYRFKQGFGGQVVKYPGAFDYPYSRLGYFLYKQYRKRMHAEG